MYSPMDRHSYMCDICLLQKEIQRLRKENQTYKKENYELRNDNMVLAALIRTTLGYDYHSRYE